MLANYMKTQKTNNNKLQFQYILLFPQKIRTNNFYSKSQFIQYEF